MEIIGFGQALPTQTINNEELIARHQINTTNDWIIVRTGIQTRRLVTTGETGVKLAVAAAKQALASSASQEKRNIDGIIVGTYSSDWGGIPSNACLIQKELGLARTGWAFDLSAACSGLIYAFFQAEAILKAGLARRLLVIGVEVNSWVLDWSDRDTAILFGDGACAFLLGRGRSRQKIFLDHWLMADGDGALDLTIARHGRMKMTGKKIYRFAVNALEETIQMICDRNNLRPTEINYFIPHQANQRIVESVADKLQLPRDKFLTNLDRLGNTGSASAGLVLVEALTRKIIQPGDFIILAAVGGGYTWGGSLLKW